MIYVDADACPVKPEAERVATRAGVKLFLVSNGGLRPSQNPLVEMVYVPDGPDVADMWIADRAGPGDVVVGISQSGSSKDPVYTLKQAKVNGVSTICITGNAQSPITQVADVTLLSVAREARIEAIASRIAQMSIADALYIIVALNNIDTAIQNEKLIWDALLPKMF